MIVSHIILGEYRILFSNKLGISEYSILSLASEFHIAESLS